MRLAAEVLESREGPAAYYWAPPSTNDLLSTTAGNWLTGPGAPYLPASTAPGAGDHLYFTHDVSNEDCIVPPDVPPIGGGGESFAAGGFGELSMESGQSFGGSTPSGGVFAGMHLVDEYAGVVELQRVVSVGTLEMAAPDAAIWQHDLATYSLGDAGTLTITASLDWTGGTLNNGSVAGQINLAATATGTAAPTDDGTVKLGSNLDLLGDATNQTGSTLTMRDGDFELYNGVGIRARAYCNLNLAPINFLGETRVRVRGKAQPEQQDEKGLIEIDPDARATVRPGNRPNGNTKQGVVTLDGPSPILRNKGWLFIEDISQVLIDPNAGKVGYYEQTTDTGEPVKSLTRIEANCEIKSTEKGDPNHGHVNIHTGQLLLAYAQDANHNPLATQLPAKITAPNGSAEPALYVGDYAKVTTGFYTVFLKLEINGKFKCDGDVELRMDRTSEDNHDTIEATEKITFQASALRQSQLRLRWNDPMATPRVGLNKKWSLIYSRDDVNGIDVLPSITPPSEANPPDAGMTLNADTTNKQHIKEERTG